jgi:hypothetical protein
MYQIKNEDERQKTLRHIEGLKAQIERILLAWLRQLPAGH